MLLIFEVYIEEVLVVCLERNLADTQDGLWGNTVE